MRYMTESKEVEEMTKKELIELVDIITIGFIEVYNDNIILAQTIDSVRHSLDDIDYDISQLINDIDSLMERSTKNEK